MCRGLGKFFVYRANPFLCPCSLRFSSMETGMAKSRHACQPRELELAMILLVESLRAPALALWSGMPWLRNRTKHLIRIPVAKKCILHGTVRTSVRPSSEHERQPSIPSQREHFTVPESIPF